MTSQIEVDEVRGLTAGGKFVNLMRALPKAWASINGAGVISAYDSMNVSSLTDAGAGNYIHNLTAPVSLGSGGWASGNNSANLQYPFQITRPDTASYRVLAYNASTFADVPEAYSGLMGNLAP